MESSFATHAAPVWRDRANYLIVADLASYDMPGRWEQLWARQIADEEFEICCIPYFTYGLALGDIVRTRQSGSTTHVVADLLQRSGRQVLRLWLKDADTAGVEQVYAYLVKQAPLHEWSSQNLLAIDLPPDNAVGIQQLAVLLEELKKFGIEAEWGN